MGNGHIGYNIMYYVYKYDNVTKTYYYKQYKPTNFHLIKVPTYSYTFKHIF